MSTYRVTFLTTAEITVAIEAEDEDTAADEAWPLAEMLTDIYYPPQNGAQLTVLSLDGIGAETVEEVTS